MIFSLVHTCLPDFLWDYHTANLSNFPWVTAIMTTIKVTHFEFKTCNEIRREQTRSKNAILALLPHEFKKLSLQKASASFLLLLQTTCLYSWPCPERKVLWIRKLEIWTQQWKMTSRRIKMGLLFPRCESLWISVENKVENYTQYGEVSVSIWWSVRYMSG
jgi:hypothetical protein